MYIFLLITLVMINYVAWFRYPLYTVLIGGIGLYIGFIFSITNLDKIDKNSQFVYFDNTKSNIICRVADIYKESSLGNSYICTLDSIDSKKSINTINILTKLNSSTKLKIGDVIEFDSKIQKVVNPIGFNYEKYLLLRGIYGTVNIYKFENIGKDLNIFEKFIINLKGGILEILTSIYPGDSNKLLAGIFLGIRGDFGEELSTNFNRSGLSHIVAVSGFNITILIVFLSIILRFLPDYVRIISILLGIIIFVMLVGNNSTAIRAAIMGIIAFLAMNYGRKINIYSVMVFTIILFALYNPLTLNYDIGFHLSFLALLGLVCFGETSVDMLNFLPTKFSIRESVGTTIAVLIFTIPIMLINFGTVSIISPVSNLLATPLISPVMLFGFISVILYSIWPILGVIVGFITYVLLELILKIVQILGGLDFSVLTVDLGNWGYYFFIIYYIILLIITVEIHLRTKGSKSPQAQASEAS